MSLVETFEHNGKTIEIHLESDPISPRSDDCLCKIAHWHKKYALGESIEHMTEQEFKEKNPNIIAIKPLYMYEHGSVLLNTTGFSCRFDSGQVGFVYITKDDAESFGFYLDTGVSYELNQVIDGEIESYSAYLSGSTYMWKVGEANCSWFASVKDALEDAKFYCE